VTSFKRILLIVSFLAYGAALAHNFVPHHHHEEEPEHHSHDGQHSHQSHHHHNDADSDDSKSLSYFFSEAIHHPAAKVSLHNHGEGTQKVKPFDVFLIAEGHSFKIPEFVPPDTGTKHRTNLFPVSLCAASLLRGPPVA
jgi:hypothetical protein